MSLEVESFRAMGAACSISVFDAGDGRALAELGRTRVALLEQSWSRFREDSELNRLNARAGTGPVEVSADLLTLLWHMQRAWVLTDGLFDPTLLAAIRATGYDADFAAVIARDAVAGAIAWGAPQRSRGMADIVIDIAASTVALPADIGIDPGAIGKGLAGDLIVDELMGAGAGGVLVDLGGDIVVGGRPGSDEAWVIAIEDERDPDNDAREPMLVTFDVDGSTAAIATSSTLYRRWAGGTRHHVIDPRTGQMADPELVQATVWCAAGWLAEASATAAMLMEREQAIDWLQAHELGYTVMTADAVVSSLQGVLHG
ncbi:MAG: FAD:protein FMN transferase [Candidatus Nanopelagicales bacterium]|nr:FAD:protein FMN transferase [Candidatus Nanopelagicales bacterium]